MKYKWLLLLIGFLWLVPSYHAQSANSLTVIQSYQNEKLTDGEVAIYFLGNIKHDNIELINNEVVSISQIADKYATFTQQFESLAKDATQIKQSFNSDGAAHFEQVIDGLYLIKHLVAPESFHVAKSSLVIMNHQPMTVYLKLAPKPKEPDTTTTTTIDTPEKRKDEIPYTGQNWWYVIVFSMLGLLAIIVSFLIGKK